MSKAEKSVATIALGYFDSLHYGHRKIISSMASYAKENNFKSVVFTFSNNLYDFFGGGQKQIYTFAERKKELCELGVDEIIACRFDERLKNMPAKDFLEMISQKYNVAGIFCGYDYKFGANAQGGVDYLREYFGEDKVFVFPEIKFDDRRISTTLIRELLQSGNIEEANRCLVKPFSVEAEVVHGRGQGHIYDFPTANLDVPTDKFLPKRGVYATVTIVNGKRFLSVTNVGAEPTFGINSETTESMLLDFNENIYGKTVKTEFYAYLREIQTFPSINDLKNQIYRDAERCKKLCSE